MSENNQAFITRMKLAELSKQRDYLLTTCTTLSQANTDHQPSSVRLEQLYEGLKQIAFAGNSLHPDIASLHLLMDNIVKHPAASALVDFWLQRLEKEIGYGRNRAEAVYVFGALLEEWSQAKGAEPGQQRDTLTAHLIEPIATPGAQGDYETLLTPLLAWTRHRCPANPPQTIPR